MLRLQLFFPVDAFHRESMQLLHVLQQFSNQFQLNLYFLQLHVYFRAIEWRYLLLSIHDCKHQFYYSASLSLHQFSQHDQPNFALSRLIHPSLNLKQVLCFELNKLQLLSPCLLCKVAQIYQQLQSFHPNCLQRQKQLTHH